MCEFYDSRVTGQCREERAEEVRDKEHANFCDWFKPRPDAHLPPDGGKTKAAKAKIDSLFDGPGAADSQPDSTRDKLADLFGVNDKSRK